MRKIQKRPARPNIHTMTTGRVWLASGAMYERVSQLNNMTQAVKTIIPVTIVTRRVATIPIPMLRGENCNLFSFIIRI
jgi:hypothetical protein